MNNLEISTLSSQNKKALDEVKEPIDFVKAALKIAEKEWEILPNLKFIQKVRKSEFQFEVPVPNGFSRLFEKVLLALTFRKATELSEYNANAVGFEWEYEHPDGTRNGKTIGTIFFPIDGSETIVKRR